MIYFLLLGTATVFLTSVAFQDLKINGNGIE